MDENLVWTKHVNWVKSKLNQAIGILSKLRHNSNLPILRVAYHSLFGSHLQYGCQLWGQGNQSNQNAIQILQNRALSKITFKKYPDPSNPIYKELKILKFADLLHIRNCLFISQIEQNDSLAKSFATLKHCGDNHNYNTRASTKKILDTPSFKTEMYGTQSVKYHCIIDWNQFKRTFTELPETDYTYSKIKSILTNHYLDKY